MERAQQQILLLREGNPNLIQTFRAEDRQEMIRIIADLLLQVVIEGEEKPEVRNDNPR